MDIVGSILQQERLELKVPVTTPSFIADWLSQFIAKGVHRLFAPLQHFVRHDGLQLLLGFWQPLPLRFQQHVRPQLLGIGLGIVLGELGSRIDDRADLGVDLLEFVLFDHARFEDATAHAGAASTLRVTAAGEALLDRATGVVTELDARFALQYPELTEALRACMTRVMSGSP